MTIPEQHEQFEMEILYRLKSSKLLDSLIFGGGTMLRLCHDLNRYSADLDFWKLKNIADETLFSRLRENLSKDFEITDAKIKHFTILFELRSPGYPKRLKIEIRRNVQPWEIEDKIAYSRFANRQILLKAHTLKQALQNKVTALLTRGEIRDAFDLEFLLRQGIALPLISADDKVKILKRLTKFKTNDYKVTLGAVLEKEFRDFYIKNKFQFLVQKIKQCG